MHPYEKLAVWRRAHEVAVGVYRISAGWPDPALRGQLRRAAQSVAANIVEGAGAPTAAQFARFLGIALASAHEVDYHLRFAEDVGLLPPAIRARFADEVIQVKRMLLALHRTVRERALATKVAEKAEARRAGREDREVLRRPEQRARRD